MRPVHAIRQSIFRNGFSLVELLIVLTIIGILVAALMPAIQSSREAARRTQCLNNLRQFGLAGTYHLNASGFFPSSGWGYRWAGDPDRGYGSRQPGGWVYSILAYVEEKELWSAGAGISFITDPTDKTKALANQVNRPIPILYCPSRRDALIYPYTPSRPPINLNLADLATGVLKTDYAINCGDTGVNQYPGPDTMQEVDSGEYQWPANGYTGISFQASQVTAPQVTDGLSHTYFAGEKYLTVKNYGNGVDLGDNDAATQGFDNDMCRLAGPDFPPMCDTFDEQNLEAFGSAHAEGFNMVFCDGSVHMIDYSIDPVVHGHLANRADGQTTNSNSVH